MRKALLTFLIIDRILFYWHFLEILWLFIFQLFYNYFFHLLKPLDWWMCFYILQALTVMNRKCDSRVCGSKVSFVLQKSTPKKFLKIKEFLSTLRSYNRFCGLTTYDPRAAVWWNFYSRQQRLGNRSVGILLLIQSCGRSCVISCGRLDGTLMVRFSLACVS